MDQSADFTKSKLQQPNSEITDTEIAAGQCKFQEEEKKWRAGA
jgi:hypothetical protein